MAKSPDQNCTVQFEPSGLKTKVPVGTVLLEAAQKVGQEGVRWVAGSIDAGSADVAPLLATIPHDAIRASQSGLLADMDHVADMLYGRNA